MEPVIQDDIPVPPRRGRPKLERATRLVEVSPSQEIQINAPEQSRFVESPITRFTLFDMPTWGDWLCSRLDRQWPNKNRMFWQGKVNNITSSNDFLFIKNDDSVLLIMSHTHLLDDRPRAQEVFAWSKHATPMKWEPDRLSIADNRDAQRSLLALYRFGMDWVRGRGTKNLIAGIVTDMPIERLEKSLGGKCADWVVIW